MSDAEMFAHYKQTAPVEDIRFFIKTARMSDAVRVEAETLLADVTSRKMARPEVYRRLTAVQAHWRRENWQHNVGRHADRIARRLAKARERSRRAEALAIAVLAETIVVVETAA